MKLPTLVQIAKGWAHFELYADGELHYRLDWTDGIEEEHLEFRIPIDDSGSGAFTPIMRGIEVLRWVRKHVEVIENERKNQDQS